MWWTLFDCWIIVGRPRNNTGTSTSVCLMSLDSGIIQNPVHVHFLHRIINSPLSDTSQLMSVVLTFHPTLHSFTTDTSEWLCNPGSTCTTSDASGGSFISNSHM